MAISALPRPEEDCQYHLEEKRKEKLLLSMQIVMSHLSIQKASYERESSSGSTLLDWIKFCPTVEFNIFYTVQASYALSGA
jgi:hypothetical protein